MKASVFASAVLCGLVAFPAAAFAQDQVWLKDRRYTEGPGYRVGDFELHPGRLARVRARLQLPPRSATTRGRSHPRSGARCASDDHAVAVVLHARRSSARRAAPGAYAPDRRVQGRHLGHLQPGHPDHLGLDHPRSERNLGGNLDLALGILPGASGRGSSPQRTVRACSRPGEQRGQRHQLQLAEHPEPRRGAGRRRGRVEPGRRPVRAAARLPVHRHDLRGSPGAAHQPAEPDRDARTLALPAAHLDGVRRALRLHQLPRTPAAVVGPAGIYAGKTSSHPDPRAHRGQRARARSSFAVLAMVGWGASFYSSSSPDATHAQNFDSVIGQAEAQVVHHAQSLGRAERRRRSTTLSSAISVGFLRDFYDSYVGSTYFERDRGATPRCRTSTAAGSCSWSTAAPAPSCTPRSRASALGAAPRSTTSAPTQRSSASTASSDSFGINATVRYNQNENSSHTPVATGEV